MITVTRTTPNNFNGVQFEKVNGCIVYKIDDITYFVSSNEIKNLDVLIAENVQENSLEV